MGRYIAVLIGILILSACTPVLREEVMKGAVYDFNPSVLAEDPGQYKGRVFILGGIIVATKVTEKGSQIEALFVPVDSRGYFIDSTRPGGRFLAIYPKEKGILDPLIYQREKRVTIAGEFIGTSAGKIDDMDYTFPLFEIRDIYLWNVGWDYMYSSYYGPGYSPYYPYYPSYPFMYPYRSWYDPWWRYPYPYPYW